MKQNKNVILKFFVICFLLVTLKATYGDNKVSINTIKAENKHYSKAIEGDNQIIEGDYKGVGVGFSFKFDKNGVPCIAYYDFKDNELKFSKVQKGRWITSTIDSSPDVEKGLFCTLVFNDKNQPLVSYVSQDSNLSISKYNGKKWIREIIDNKEGSGYYCRMQVFQNEKVAITYKSPKGLMVALKINEKWSIENIDANGDMAYPFFYPDGSLTVFYRKGNLSGKIISCSHKDKNKWQKQELLNTDKTVFFEVNSYNGIPTIILSKEKGLEMITENSSKSGTWKSEKISDKKINYISSVFTKDKKKLMVSISNDNKKLEMIKKDKNNWVFIPLATARTNYKFNSCHISMYKNKKPIVIFHDQDSLSALICTKNGWMVGRIAGKIKVGGFISAVLNAQKQPMVAYYDFTRQELHFAQKINKNIWKLKNIDSLGDVGKYSSIAVDMKDNPGIAYYDSSRKDLKYAWKQKGNWNWERVDFAQDVGEYPSLAYDRKNIPFISYYSKADKKIKIALKKGNKWQIRDVASKGNIGKEIVLLMKNGNKPIIFYIDGKKQGRTIKYVYLKMAESVGVGKWKITTILDSRYISPALSGLSGTITPLGDIYISFIDKKGNLRVLIRKGGSWQMQEIEKSCWDDTSIKYNGDGSISLLYIKGDIKRDEKIFISRYDGKIWRTYSVELPHKRFGYISLLSSPFGVLRFVYTDLEISSAVYFESFGLSDKQ